jgi:hypothetical protein
LSPAPKSTGSEGVLAGDCPAQDQGVDIMRAFISGPADTPYACGLWQFDIALPPAYPVVPPHVEYSLTPLGEELAPKVIGLIDWIETNLHRIIPADPALGD